MIINVVWLPPENQWDQYTFQLLFNNRKWLPVGSYVFAHHKSFDTVPNLARGIILVVPHKYYVEKVDWINQSVEKYKWLLYVGTGNEEAEFPIEQIVHPNKIVYYTTPHLKRTKFEAIDRLLGDGYAPQSECLVDYEKEAQEKSIDLYFGGQVTHERREMAMKAIKYIDEEKKEIKVEYLESQGFTQGYPDYHTYYEKMARAKIVPCPSGPNTPDTFRSYEALEAMALPILDSKTIYDTEATDYWARLFGEDPPFPIIRDDWESLNGYAHGILEEWHPRINKAVAWWIARKRQYAYELVQDLDKLTGGKNKQTVNDKITVIVLTSPIPSNPSTAKIDECITSIRAVLPDAEILIGIDGVREEQENRRPAYEEFTTRLLWNCLHKWQSVLPVVFERHMHQAAMTKHLLTLVKTPTIFFVEHDMVVTSKNETPYPPYEWSELVDIIEEGTANIIRFHFEAVFPVEHLPLMLGERELVRGIPMIKTVQYSQRPFLASTAFYKDLIDRYFTDESRTFIEDRVHGLPVEAYNQFGIPGWNLWRIWIYAPEGNMKRSETIDGREDDEKYPINF
jgi:hypothetical protein